jgi:phosphoribosylanthranilate isomerase
VTGHTRIKICGITRPEDAEATVAAGVDAIGFAFTELSARRIAPEAAAEIAELVGDRALRVGLFVDPSREAVETVLERVALDVLQFHGDETAAFCGSFDRPYMKVHRVRTAIDSDVLKERFPDACCHMLDTYVEGQPGGTGETFDWSLWPRQASVKLVLAGGLTPENVGQAVAATRPYAVDASGGVEAGIKGIKDAERIRQFVAAVRQADAVAERH